KEDHVCRGLNHTSIDGNRLTSVFFEDDSPDTRMLLASQQFRRTVGRAIRDDNDLLNVRVIQAKQMLDLARKQRRTVMNSEHNANAGSDRGNLPGPRLQ